MKFISLFGSNSNNVGYGGNVGQQNNGNMEDMFNNSF
jgi:hypothetical protein